MTMTTNTFQVPLLDRGDDQGLPMDLTEYNKSTTQVKHLVATNQASAAMLVCDQAGYIRTLGDVDLKMTNTQLAYAIVNLSNEEYLPARVGKELFKHFIVVAPRSDLHSGAISGETLPDDVLANAIPGAHVRIGALPMGIVVGRKKGGWIEGHSSEPGVQDDIESNYGADAKKWAQSIAHASANLQAIGSVWVRLKAAQRNALQACLGEDFDKLDIWEGAPHVSIIPLTRAMDPDLYDERRTRSGPYKAPTEHPAPAPAPAAGGGFDAEALAKALATKKDRDEIDKLSEGAIIASGIFMGGGIDKLTGKISSAVLSQPTSSYLECLEATTVGERTKMLKRVLDTGNQARPQGSVNATLRDMDDHDETMVRNIATGNWSKTPIEKSGITKVTQVGIVCWLPYSRAMLNLIAEESKRTKFAAAVDSVLEGSMSSRDWIACFGKDVGYQELKNMFSNFEADGMAMFLQTGILSWCVVYAQVFLAMLVDTNTFNWFKNHNDEQQQMNFIFFCILRYDWYMCKMVETAQHYEIYGAIKKKQPEEIDLSLYERATMAIADDVKEAKKWVTRNKACEEKIPVLNFTLEGEARIPKKQRVGSAPSPAPAPAAQPPARGAAQRAASNPMDMLSPYAAAFGGSGAGGWGNAWGNGASDSAWSNSVEERRKKSMKSGDLVVKPGFTGFPLATGLSGYCPDYNTVGRACDGYNRKHVAVSKLSQDLQDQQIAYVERNKADVLFTPMAVQRGLKLPSNKKFLVANENGHAAGERN